MEALEAVLSEFYGAETDNARKRQIDQELQNFKNSPGSHKFALQGLYVSSNPLLQWYCASILEVHRKQFYSFVFITFLS